MYNPKYNFIAIHSHLINLDTVKDIYWDYDDIHITFTDGEQKSFAFDSMSAAKEAYVDLCNKMAISYEY